MQFCTAIHIATEYGGTAMNGSVALAVTHHDPEQRMERQIAQWLPVLQQYYAHLAIIVTADTNYNAWITPAAALSVQQLPAQFPAGMAALGQIRQMVVQQAWQHAPHISHVHLCDFDRILHWVAHYPVELAHVVAHITHADLTVLGRTPRAFATHPRTQRDTESLINHVFELASGRAWDVTAASRGLSRRASAYLAERCADPTVGVDCAWVLCALQQPELVVAYSATEGLEFETADRYPAEIAAAGSVSAWIATLDASPQQWLQRLQVAMLEVASINQFGDHAQCGER